MHAYLWDRYYGVCLTKYQHQDVVNSVAFNPRDNEMLVTTSDDYEIKVLHGHYIVSYCFDICLVVPGLEIIVRSQEAWYSTSGKSR